MPAWTGTLSTAQRRAYTHLADLWEVTNAIAAGAFPSDPSYGAAPVLTAVPAYRRTKSAVDAPEILGLVEGEDMITVDVWRFPVNVELSSSWIIIDRSLTPDGDPGQNYGLGWVAKGDPVREEDWTARRKSGIVEAYASRLVELPAEITAYYA